MTPSPRLVQVRPAPEAVPVIGDPWPDVHRVLVVPRAGLGRLVLLSPALAALRAAYPRAFLTVQVGAPWAPLARLLEPVDAVVTWPPDAEPDRPLVEGTRPDLLLTPIRHPRMAWAARRSGVRHAIGPAESLFSRLYERRVAADALGDARHEVEIALAYAGAAGARPPRPPVPFPLRIPEDAREGTARWLELQGIRGRFVVVHAGSTGSTPSWPTRHHLRLAALLVAEGCPVVFSIGRSDGSVWSALDAAEPAVRRLPRFSGTATSFAALLAAACAVVGTSSGAIHLAAAAGTPTLSFHPEHERFGPQRRGPYAANGWALLLPVSAEERWRAGRHGESQPLAAISPAAALQCVLALTEGRTPSLDAPA